MTESRDLNKFLVRMPDGMRDRIAEAAKSSNRSMNSEIVARLEASFSDDAMSLIAEQGALIRDQAKQNQEMMRVLNSMAVTLQILKDGK